MKRFSVIIAVSLIVGLSGEAYAGCQCRQTVAQANSCQCRKACAPKQPCVSPEPSNSSFQQYADWIHCWPCTPSACREKQGGAGQTSEQVSEQVSG